MKRTKTPMVKAKAPVERKKKADYNQFHLYVEKVRMQVHPDMGMNQAAKEMVNDFVLHMVHRVSCTVHSLLHLTHAQTVSARDIQSAVRMIIPGELAKHAVSEGTKAVTKYKNVKDERLAEDFLVKGDFNNKGKRKEALCGLQFPIARVGGMLRNHLHTRIGETAPVYLTGVLEYLVAEILELGGNMARAYKKVRITPRHLLMAIQNDEELRTLTKHCTIPGGEVPDIHQKLVEVYQKKRK